jgi:hypothetical protein
MNFTNFGDIMRNLTLLTLCWVAISFEGFASTSSVFHHAPQALGTIEDQILMVNGNFCGPNFLNFDVTPYFEGYGEPLSYCLSSVNIEGTVSNLQVTLNPYNGLLQIPLGWFGVQTLIKLHIIAKNPYGSAMQTMDIYLEACGG